jgi:hypothetical protein
LKTSFPIIAGIALIICFSCLCIPAFLAKGEKIENVLLVVPSEISSPRLDIQLIEEFSEKEFLMTYEIPASQRVSLSNAEYPVTLIGTNSGYFSILDIAAVEGSFFSKQAWSGKLKHAALNEKAAFTIFGSSRIAGSRFRMGNEIWLVTGVIQDGDDDHCKVYVPSSVRGAQATALLVLMSPSGGLNEDYVKNNLKTLGIREGNFNFYNLGTRARLLWERVKVIPLLFFSLLFLGLIIPMTGKLKNSLAALRMEMHHRYPSEILQKDRNIILQPVVIFLGMGILIALALFLILRFVSICLPWQDIPSLGGLDMDLMYPRIIRLRDYNLISLLFFGLSLVDMNIFFVCIISFFRGKPPVQH